MRLQGSRRPAFSGSGGLGLLDAPCLPSGSVLASRNRNEWGSPTFSWKFGGGGLWACLMLTFATEVRGPLIACVNRSSAHWVGTPFSGLTPASARNFTTLRIALRLASRRGCGLCTTILRSPALRRTREPPPSLISTSQARSIATMSSHLTLGGVGDSWIRAQVRRCLLFMFIHAPHWTGIGDGFDA